MKDIEKEQEHKRLELVDTIREQGKEIDFFNGIISYMLKEGEMYKIKDKVEYDYDRNRWIVPPFFVKAKEVNLPKIKNADALVKQEMDARELVWQNNGEVISADDDVTSGGSKRSSMYGGIPTGKSR